MRYCVVTSRLSKIIEVSGLFRLISVCAVS